MSPIFRDLNETGFALRLCVCAGVCMFLTPSLLCDETYIKHTQHHCKHKMQKDRKKFLNTAQRTAAKQQRARARVLIYALQTLQTWSLQLCTAHNMLCQAQLAQCGHLPECVQAIDLARVYTCGRVLTRVNGVSIILYYAPFALPAAKRTPPPTSRFRGGGVIIYPPTHCPQKFFKKISLSKIC